MATEKLEQLHSDLSGIITPPSLGGSRYSLKITDSCTSYKFVYLLRNKSQTLPSFMQFTQYIENQTSKRIKNIVNNNGGEYTSAAFQDFVKQRGIDMRLTAPYTPQQNSVAEIGNQTTTEKARALLKHAGLPSTFWTEAVSTAVYLENRNPVAPCGFRTPYELWHGLPPTYNHLRLFGCMAYVHVGRERRAGKFSDTAKRGVFFGYQEGHHNYRVWLPEEQRIIYSHDVVFNEDRFPLKGPHSSFTDSNKADYLLDISPSTPDLTPSTAHPLINDIELDTSDDLPSATLNPSSVTPDTIISSGIVEGARAANYSAINTVTLTTPVDPASELTAPADTQQHIAKLEISSKIDPANIIQGRTRRPARLAFALRSSHTSLPDPTTYSQATSRHDSHERIESMNREVKALEDMKVWEEVRLPKGQHALGTTWVYKRKTGPSGELIKYKSRLCAQGFSQVEGIDFSETYAPTGRLSTLRTALSLSATEDYEIIQMDAVGAFLNGTPDETLYIRIPKEYIFKMTGDDMVLKLNKSVYGLKQSPRCWYCQLSDFFKSINFMWSKADPCFFVSCDPDWTWGVFIHVDDMCIMGRNTDRLKQLISQRFVMEDLGECTYFLGMRIVRNRAERTITLYQDKYVDTILSEYGMDECRPTSTPMIPNTHLTPATEEDRAEFIATGENYRRAVGLLNYLVS